MVNFWPQDILLHDHLDGSEVLLPIIDRLHELDNKFCRFHTVSARILKAELKNWFFSDRDIVDRFSVTTGVMQTRQALALTAMTYVRLRHQQGFRYCEFTIAPQYHVFKGLNEKEVINALIEGIKLGESICYEPEIEVNILFSIGREVDPDEAVRLVEVAGECDRNYVVGIGLVCDEACHPPEKHAPMFKKAKELGFKTTCHAGEWVHSPDQEPDMRRDLDLLIKNIRTAVFELQVDRIGHAIGLAYDSNLLKAVVDKGIGIEGCPGSNLASGLITDVSVLKIREILEAGVLYSIHPDDDLFLPDIEEAFSICNKEYKFNQDEIRQLLTNPWKVKFGSRKKLSF